MSHSLLNSFYFSTKYETCDIPFFILLYYTSIIFQKRKTSQQGKEPEEKNEAPKAIAEMRSQGAVSSDVYKKYLQAGGNWFTFTIVFGLIFLAQVAGSCADYWVSFW
jgi:hypothetical protein